MKLQREFCNSQNVDLNNGVCLNRLLITPMYKLGTKRFHRVTITCRTETPVTHIERFGALPLTINKYSAINEQGILYS